MPPRPSVAAPDPNDTGSLLLLLALLALPGGPGYAAATAASVPGRSAPPDRDVTVAAASLLQRTFRRRTWRRYLWARAFLKEPLHVAIVFRRATLPLPPSPAAVKAALRSMASMRHEQRPWSDACAGALRAAARGAAGSVAVAHVAAHEGTGDGVGHKPD